VCRVLVCRVPEDATAFSLRKPGAVQLDFWTERKSPTDASRCMPWVRKDAQQSLDDDAFHMDEANWDTCRFFDHLEFSADLCPVTQETADSLA
jgi:hypothetical protein